MRFQHSAYVVSTWETDEYNRKIAGTEQQLDRRFAEQATAAEAMGYAMRKRQLSLLRGCNVLGEIWSIDSERPAAKFVAESRVRGIQAWGMEADARLKLTS